MNMHSPSTVALAPPAAPSETWDRDPLSGQTLRLVPGDCLASLGTMPDESVDSVVTDPPYGLAFMGRSWDSPDTIAFHVAFWREPEYQDDIRRRLDAVAHRRAPRSIFD